MPQSMGAEQRQPDLTRLLIDWSNGNQQALEQLVPLVYGELRRLAERYLIEGRDKPVYIYGPMCDGMEEMVVVPRCQNAIALGVWDPYLNDYIVYSTLHGDSVMESEGFQSFLEVTGKAAGVVRKAAKFVP